MVNARITNGISYRSLYLANYLILHKSLYMIYNYSIGEKLGENNFMFRRNQANKILIENKGFLDTNFQFIDTTNISHDLAYDFELFIGVSLDTIKFDNNGEIYYLIKPDGQPWLLIYKKTYDAELQYINLPAIPSLDDFNQLLDGLQNKKIPDDLSNSDYRVTKIIVDILSTRK